MVFVIEIIVPWNSTKLCIFLTGNQNDGLNIIIIFFYLDRNKYMLKGRAVSRVQK